MRLAEPCVCLQDLDLHALAHCFKCEVFVETRRPPPLCSHTLASPYQIFTYDVTEPAVYYYGVRSIGIAFLDPMCKDNQLQSLLGCLQVGQGFKYRIFLVYTGRHYNVLECVPLMCLYCAICCLTRWLCYLRYHTWDTYGRTLVQEYFS